MIYLKESQEQKDYGINFTRLCYFILGNIIKITPLLIKKKHLLASTRKKKQSYGVVSYLQNTSID